MIKDHKVIYIPDEVKLKFRNQINKIEDKYFENSKNGFSYISQYGESRLFITNEDAKKFSFLLKEKKIKHSIHDSSKYIDIVTKTNLENHVAKKIFDCF